MTRFGTAGIRGHVSEVTPALALSVGRAMGVETLDRGHEEVAVGRDGRVTGPALAAAVEAGLASAGVDVRRVGVVPTPALAFASRGRTGVMLTASHNPPSDNGIKLFADGVEFDREAESRIEALVDDGPDAAAWDDWGATTSEGVLERYRDAVIAYAEDHGAPLSGLAVVVDCGNGMASRATPGVLRALGADVTAINANVDGRFPGRDSKPTAGSLSDLRAYLAGGPADLGIAHDGDADRTVVLDGGGEVIHEDTVLAILAEHYTRASDAGDPVVVTTPNASARVDDRVRAAGGRVERVRLGALHEGISSVREAGGGGTAVVFAAEPWKHVHPAFGGWIDGVASAAVLARLVAEAGGIDALRAPVVERPYRKTEVACPDGTKAAAMSRLEEALPAEFPDGEVDTRYGVRIDLPDDSWVLVRPSGTEAYIRIYAESEAVDRLVDRVVPIVEAAVEAASA